MLQWIPYVMVRVVIFFATGILAGIYFPDKINENLASAIFLFFLFTYFILRWALDQSYWRGTIAGCVGLTCVFLAGYLMLLRRTDSRKALDITHQELAEYYTGYAAEPGQKAGSVRLEINIDNIKTRGQWRKASGKVLLYITGEKSGTTITAGDHLIVKGAPASVPLPLNPGEFDFKNYLLQKNISRQHRIAREEVRIISKNNEDRLTARAQQARAWSTAIIKRFIKGEREQGITMALVLGVTDGIDNELQDAYSASGAMHVLSVSGLHVGIIYAIILLILKPIRSLAWSRWLVAFISLVALWAYAFITGLSPSVLRAVMMFSFMVAARPFGRNTNIYNTLAASAFLLLLVNPYLILSVGFQLSYLAVLGIVCLQRPIYNQWEPAWIGWDKLWQVTSVSIAAQLATFALSLFYFHQFPVYFLISNMLVIPLSTAVLVAGIVLLVVSPFHLMAEFMAWAVELLVKILNGTVFFIERLPMSVIDNVLISAVQCWLLMTIVIFIILCLQQRSFRLVLIVAVLAMTFGALSWIRFSDISKKDQLVVFAVKGHSVVGRTRKGRGLLMLDSPLLSERRQLRYHILPYFVGSAVGKVDTIPFHRSPHLERYGWQMFIWNRKRIVLIDRPKPDLPSNVEADLLIAGNNAVNRLDSLSGKIHFKHLILASSNSRVVTDRILKEASARRIDVSTTQEGACIIDLGL